MAKGHVLIIEDEMTIAESLQELLSLEDYQSDIATNGKAAQEWLQAHPKKPTTILLDLMMPICSGYEFLEMTKDDAMVSEIPIIVISAAADAATTAQKYHAQFVRKPLDADQILKAIDRLHTA